ncbi:MAG: XisI protein [Cyanobacteria bacterium P01_D01_bin.128]
MDRVNQYRAIICQTLESFAEGDPEADLVFDTTRDRYLVLHSAWRGESRIYGCAMQLDLIDGKIWIQHNSTEIDLYQLLKQQGVEAKDIILGLRSPAVRDRLAAAT